MPSRRDRPINSLLRPTASSPSQFCSVLRPHRLTHIQPSLPSLCPKSSLSPRTREFPEFVPPTLLMTGPSPELFQPRLVDYVVIVPKCLGLLGPFVESFLFSFSCSVLRYSVWLHEGNRKRRRCQPAYRPRTRYFVKTLKFCGIFAWFFPDPSHGRCHRIPCSSISERVALTMRKVFRTTLNLFCE